MVSERTRSIGKKIAFRTLVFALIAITRISFASETISDGCMELPEKRVVDAILNQQYAQAQILADALNLDHALIPSSKFYRALAVWHQGYQQENVKLKVSGIAALRKAIHAMHNKLSTAPPRVSSLAMGLSKGHTARVLLENAQYVSGYEMGMQAKDHLDQFRALSDESDIGFDDSGLLVGLFEVYTHDFVTQNQWLKRNIVRRGDRENGITLIENAVNGRSIFASEAMRALLTDVSWRTPRTCKYVDATDYFGRQFFANKDFATLRQGLLLKCGHTNQAKYANEDYKKYSDLPAGMEKILIKARLRIFADLGNFDYIDKYQVPAELEIHRQLAYANALDVASKRTRAYKEYERLAASTDTPTAIRSVAKVRLHYPYDRPEKIEIPQFKVSFVEKDRC